MILLKILHGIVWGPWTLVLFLGSGLWLTLRLRGFQVTGFPVWWKETAGSLTDLQNSGGSAFRGACTSLAATVGTGNIVGVATALAAGGPGAVFWMWVSAGIGMATAYAETSLAQKYRYIHRDGSELCGPMVYMKEGFGSKGSGILYACMAVGASLGMGSMVQANAICETIVWRKLLPGWVCGLLLVALCGLVICGGIERISGMASVLMPCAAGVYLLFSCFVILTCLDAVPAVFWRICKEAFTCQAAAGGVSGFGLSAAMRYGLSRGVFSNEAGLGTIAVLQGSASDQTPEQQGMWAIFAVFMDTIVICTLTALVILCVSEKWQIPAGIHGGALALWCYTKILGKWGAFLVSASMILFAFATITAWYYVGRQMIVFLSEEGACRSSILLKIYPILYLAAVYAGCIGRLEAVWLLSDIWNGLMAIPNLAALILLTAQIPEPVRAGQSGITAETF